MYFRVNIETENQKIQMVSGKIISVTTVRLPMSPIRMRNRNCTLHCTCTFALVHNSECLMSNFTHAQTLVLVHYGILGDRSDAEHLCV